MFSATCLPYSKTNSFSKIVIDYLGQHPDLRPFYDQVPSLEGIREAIAQKKAQVVNRKTVVDVLNQQYNSVAASEATSRNIELLLSENTFTISTAHQPNLFTGPLYFIYKIIHAIKLSDYLKTAFPEYQFVPVYYMGSEDADLDELNHTNIEGKKLQWNTLQKGAVGRMFVDKGITQLIDEMNGQLAVHPYGTQVIELLRQSYTIGKTIQQATFELVNALFSEYGLIVLIADHPSLKAQMLDVFTQDLLDHSPSSIVQKTSERLAEHYKAQAYPRSVNLFYLKDDIRERIEVQGDHYEVLNTGIRFTKNELLAELKDHPERFSPNVVLRGLFQETILPNIVFIGGGGELAYWLQLNELFKNYNIVFPILVLRNSFLIMNDKSKERMSSLKLNFSDLFKSEKDLFDTLVLNGSSKQVTLNGSMEKATALYEQIIDQASTVDPTLNKHVTAIKVRSLKVLHELEKKMLRAEKRKYSEQQRQLHSLKEALFPKGGLQERVENFSSFYAKYGPAFIKSLYEHSLGLEQQFCILS